MRCAVKKRLMPVAHLPKDHRCEFMEIPLILSFGKCILNIRESRSSFLKGIYLIGRMGFQQMSKKDDAERFKRGYLKT